MTACREAGINGTDIEGGYGGDCIHICNYENADDIYDPDNEDNNTNAYCVDGYDFSEKYIIHSGKYSLDVCQTICLPSGQSAEYKSQTTIGHRMYMLRDAWSETQYESEYAFDSSFWTDDFKS